MKRSPACANAPIEADSSIGYEMTPERALWLGVLRQAVADACWEPAAEADEASRNSKQRAAAKRHALAFLGGAPSGMLDFPTLCELAGIEETIAAAWVRERLEAGSAD